MSAHASEAQLLAAAQTGLRRALCRYCPGALHDELDDLQQLGSLRLLAAVRRGQREFNASYLHRVARSVVIDRLRRGRPEDGSMWLEELAVSTRTPEDAATSAEVRRALDAALRSLSADRHTAVVLRLAGHSVPEIGRSQQWTTKRAENLVYRGMAEVRQRLVGQRAA